MSKLLRNLSLSSLATLNLTLLVLVIYLLSDSGTLSQKPVGTHVILALGAATALAALTWFVARRLEQTANANKLAHGPLSLVSLADGGLSRRSILDSLDEGIITADASGTVIDINHAAEHILGCTHDDLAGASNIGALIREEWPVAAGRGYQRKTAYRKNGSAFTLEYSLKCVPLDSKSIHILVIRDITQRVSTEHELSRHRERLEELIRSRTMDLARARDEALDASRAKSAFLANMSHELRTPLNAVIGYSEMILEDAAEKSEFPYLDDVEKIRMSGKHLLDLINDVLDLSKIESGKMELHLETFKLTPLVDEVITGLRPLIEKNHNRLRTSHAADLGKVEADGTKVRQIIMNLVSNAAKFTENGVITLSTRRHKRFGIDWITIEVTDSGIGMSPEQISQLFIEFNQGDTSTTRKYGGTGLGLAISRRFCEMMGGEIRVASQLGQGSTFTVEIPAKVIGPKVDPKEIRFAPTAHGLEQRRKKISRVLVIDDDPFARDLLERFLSREGFQADIAADGKTGLRMARENQPDVIILDVKMPDMDGWSVLTQIKDEPALRDIPVIMVTMTENRDLSLALGASDFLPKPIERQRLVDILVRHVRRRDTMPTPSPHVLVVEDDLMNRDMLKHALEREGMSVAVAENGLVALQQVTLRTPQLIFLDLMMPVMDGFQFIKEMRKNNDWADIPVVTLTAIDLTTEQRASLDGQVEIILDKKQLSPIELLQKLRELVVAFVRKNGSKSAQSQPAEEPANETL